MTTNDSHIAEAFAAMLAATDRDPMPFWGFVHVRHVELLRRPAWHVRGYTLQHCYDNGPVEKFHVIREPYSAFALRMAETPISPPDPDTIKFDVVVTLRLPLLNRTIWKVCITHFDHDHDGRTEWLRHLDGSVDIHHSVADKGTDRFMRCRPGLGQIRMVSAMERDLPEGLLTQFLGLRVSAGASA